MADIVLSYHNSLLRQSDLLLLEKGSWLNDNIIAFYFEYLERTFVNKFKSKVCYLNPSTSQMAKFLSYEELAPMLEGLNLSGVDFAFIAVNNNYSADNPGGCHWSLLFFDRANGKFSHFDSFHKSNTPSAEIIVNVFKQIFVCSDVIIVDVESPQQVNYNDCGVYVISFADYLSQSLLGAEHAPMDKAITPVSVEQKRIALKELIHSLNNEPTV